MSLYSQLIKLKCWPTVPVGTENIWSRWLNKSKSRDVVHWLGQRSKSSLSTAETTLDWTYPGTSPDISFSEKTFAIFSQLLPLLLPLIRD